ncbi:bacillithiol biosynthesis cysteine-adding enzyme BshC [Paenibacillus sp. 32O-W]|uniref:bacillithiol biosynthesis cysteine-adding enzyme BshC n=1 Tax=Paenibacillus sp. 32O-W TaxID=1695218 RepID=UPI0007203924|nr:bacillithiol biosynthesis cysteine-adding enzyme BshC [Paenibacillus sp. 32O-W]ALS27341.1 bacillithiol biosynthesis cysteine-adding enzyme BshC [Paenibacillus sp. 32O-W]
MTIKWETYNWPGGQPLAEAYRLRTDPAVLELFGAHPLDAEGWTQRLERLRSHADKRADIRKVAEALRAYNARFDAPEAVANNIDALAEGAPAIVGGQQAGLWTGQLLVIHKAVTVIQAARAAAGRLGRPVVPVFWIAGEDHDWDEANHAYVPGGDLEPRKIAIPRPAGARTSVSRTIVDAGAWDRALAELSDTLPDSEFKLELLERLGYASRRSATLSELFADVLTWLFGREGLVLLDADDPALRRLEAPMFRRLIEQGDSLAAAYASAAERVKLAGYGIQADVVRDSANLFLFRTDEPERGGHEASAGERTLLFRRNGRFEDRRGFPVAGFDELLRMADERPELFSNNVLTRPLMQDYVLPVLAAVLGPAEIAYWALTGEAFALLDMAMPIIVPRQSYTLVEGAIAKHIGKYGFTFDEIVNRFEAKKAEWLARHDELDIEGRFAEARRRFAEIYGPVLQLASAVDPGLTQLGETNRRKIMEQIDYMEARTIDARNRRFETVVRRLDRMARAIVPLGKPQERVINMTAYWNRYGRDWLDALLRLPFEPCASHRIVYL